MISRANFTNCENFERFYEVTEVNQRQSQIIAGERLPSWSLNLITKIILIIFTTENDSPNLARGLLMAFGDLEKRKHKIFARAPTWSFLKQTSFTK